MEDPDPDQHLTSEAKIHITNLLPEIGKEAMQKEVLQGLQARPRYIPSKYFYDKKGSALFEEITKLEEYYPTRTEKEIIASLWDKLQLDGEDVQIIELGSGDASKIELLLSQVPVEKQRHIHYIPVDISESSIKTAAARLARHFPGLRITGIVADFIHQLDSLPREGKRCFCFFGSTIGNLDKNEIRHFMTMLKNTMHNGDYFLLGLDMVKPVDVLERAYNDSKGVTARFNRNILNVTNDLLTATFDPDAFSHVAFFNQSKQRIEMHLKAEKDMDVHFGFNGQKIRLTKGETIHTEKSQKFDRKQVEKLAAGNGMRIKQQFTDPKGWFSLVYCCADSP